MFYYYFVIGYLKCICTDLLITTSYNFFFVKIYNSCVVRQFTISTCRHKLCKANIVKSIYNIFKPTCHERLGWPKLNLIWAIISLNILSYVSLPFSTVYSALTNLTNNIYNVMYNWCCFQESIPKYIVELCCLECYQQASMIPLNHKNPVDYINSENPSTMVVNTSYI